MRDHVKILGILNIVLGSLGALAGAGVLLVFGGIASVIGMSANNSNDMSAIPILGIIGFAIAMFLFVLSVPSIIGGWGLLKFQPWARILMIVISALNLLHIPIGTAIGIYGFWVLLNQETERLFATRGAYIPAPASYPAPPTYPPQPPPAV
ncbi:MAG: hypothetical protein WB992_11935 [Bryobacteraceae bacterium]